LSKAQNHTRSRSSHDARERACRKVKRVGSGREGGRDRPRGEVAVSKRRSAKYGARDTAVTSTQAVLPMEGKEERKGGAATEAAAEAGASAHSL
jgi:hypothetical protein